MRYYDVEFEKKDFIKENHLEPRGEIVFSDIFDDEALETVKKYITDTYSQCFCNPQGVLKFPYLVPGGGYTTLWDWDSFFMACSVNDDMIEYAKGSICNLLDNVGPDGRPAKNLAIDGDSDSHSTPIPLQIQYAYMIAKRLDDFSWTKKYWNSFEKIISWYDNNCMRNGLYVYRDMYGNGIDNNPAVYGRSAMSTSACDFVSFFYRDLCAIYKFAVIFGKDDEAQHYLKRVKEMKQLISEKYFDQMDNCFYSIDCNFDTKNITWQAIGWNTYLKYRNCSIIFPLWAGIATKEQAQKMRDMIMNENEFLSVCGVRSHSKADPIYNNVAMGNPSNWQGPVWGLSTFLTAYALARYGYKDDALEVAMRLVKTFALDIKQNGCIHEYYHGDSGQPIMRPHFLSWNMLALKVVDDIKNGSDSTTFDLLDI